MASVQLLSACLLRRAHGALPRTRLLDAEYARHAHALALLQLIARISAGLKAIAIDERMTVTAEFQVHFDSDLPEFKTQGGVHRAVDGNPLTVTSPPLLWLAALDKLLHNMKAAKFPFERVTAVSGSGQQHGSVFWKSGSEAHLKNMHGDKVRLFCVRSL